MTVRANKPAFNIREKLKELQKPIGLKGSELMRAETAQEARDFVSAGRKNLIINGDFKIWQRGTSFTSSSVNEYSADRFRTEGFPLNSVISQQTFTSGQTDVPGFPQYYCRVTTSSAPSSTYWALVQRIEAPQNMGAGQGIYTLSFYAKSVSGSIAPGTFEIGIGAHRKLNPELTTSWKKISVTIEADIPISSGYITAYIIRIGANISSIGVDIANVQLEVGRNATEFEHRSFGEELALCQRYFFMLGNANNTSLPHASYYTNTLIAMSVQFPVTMRANPSIYIVDGTGYFGIYRNSGFDAFDTFVIARPQPNCATLDCSGNGASGTAGQSGPCAIANSAARLGFNAEL